MRLNPSIVPLVAGLVASSAALAEGYTGDLGLGAFSHQGTYRGESAQTDVLPYVYGEWGDFFGRVDTFGYRVMPMGKGFLEVGTRIVQDEMDSNRLKRAGVRDRDNSLMLGVSTFQITSLGAISMSLMQDVGDSKGQLLDVSWIGAFKPTAWLSVYPELGLEIMSGKYADYYYGVKAGEGGYEAYKAGTALNPYFAIHAGMPLAEDWNLALTIRNKALSEEISDSPIVTRTARWNTYAAVSYDFK